MRRVVLLAAIAITVPSAVRAQACRGSVSFASAPVRFGGGAVFAKDYSGYAASLVAGKDNAAFGDVGVSRVYYDDFDDTGDDVFLEFGYQRPLRTQAQLCPMIGASIGTGPEDAGIDKARSVWAGLALGITLRPAESVKIIPNGSVRYEHASSDFDDPATGKETLTDNLGVADLGLGLIFFRDRLAIQPTVQLPFATDNTDVSYGLIISIGFAIRR